jgi:hypothetical protein
MPAIDGKSRQSWSFVGDVSISGAQVDIGVNPGTEAAERLEIEHVEEWSALGQFLEQHGRPGGNLIFAGGGTTTRKLGGCK